jgi:tetratricopeptide (TPR) repeat protein
MPVRAVATPVVLAALLSACAAKMVPLPAVGPPRYPDFVAPDVPADLTGSRPALYQERAWRFLQHGDLRNAEREVAAALAASPAFVAPKVTAGYIDLARGEPKGALGHFDLALESQAGAVSALVGRGQALLALDREADATAAFAAAVAADPSLVDLQRRLAVLRFRMAERAIAAAREAAGANRLEAARRAYGDAIASSPESPFLYRELAVVERKAGDRRAALEHLRRAVALDGTDAASIAQIGELLEEDGDLEGALSAYADSLALDMNDAVADRRDALRDRMERARLPEEYRAIDTATQLTRAQLAALIAIRLQGRLGDMPVVNAGVITDVRGSWAELWIMAVVRAGIMEPFANHTFQPAAVVRRADLAPIATRLLQRLVPAEQVQRWQSTRVAFADLLPAHLAYPSAATVVAAGVMTTTIDGAFQPSAPVTGAEAIALTDRLERLAAQPGLASVAR